MKEKDNGIYVDIRFIYIRRDIQIDIWIDIYVCVVRIYIYVYVDLSYNVKHVDVKHVDGPN